MAVIGLDGVGLPLVRELIDAGVMPALGALVREGTLAPMRSSVPTISSVSWTNFMTGRNPGKHGVYGFTDIRPGTFTMYFPNFGDVKSETVCPAGPGSGSAEPPTIPPATAPNIVFWRLAIMLRWVEMAPFGRPVVPDV